MAESKAVSSDTGRPALRRFLRRKSAVCGLVFLTLLLLLAVFADVLIDYEAVVSQDIDHAFAPLSREHPFGTDELGRDLFTRVLYGTRYSLLIGVGATLLSVAAGVLLGAFAGYYGGVFEQVVMRITDVFSALPSMLTAMAIVAVLGASPGKLILAVGLSGIPLFIRVTRGAVLEECEEDYVEAARMMGAGDLRILFLHVMPHAFGLILVQTSLRVGSAITAASGLSFLGLGLGAPLPEWGALLSAGRGFIRTHGSLCFFPGLMITLTVLSLNLVADGLRDALDPKLN